ncbi:peptidylprolyl isomerase [Sunxiuqinia sp. A32]|uniref:peptidylprolyl isomerase n=1 Tax=Sunxiuqinia sp. A32 TaxID=3461496 RepID=UPI0040454A9B
MIKKAYIFLTILLAIGVSCSSPSKKEAPQTQEKSSESNQNEQGGSYADFIPSIVKIESYNNGRFLESETAFFIEKDVVVCRLSMLDDATDARITPFNENKKYPVAGFLSVDRINDLVLLKVEGIERTPIQLYHGIAPESSKTIYLTKPQNNTLPLHQGKILNYSTIGGTKRYKVTNQFRSKSYGTPVFVSTQKSIGLAYSEVIDYENQHFVIPSNFVVDLLRKKAESPKTLDNLQTKTSKAISEANSKIKGLLIQTDMGNIKIRLFNETPEYRDNFIQLIRENYYDSLLIHRVIKGFCIQSGAADTRYAGPNDIVGWKGPGYSLPAHIVPKFYHKRGMIGSPRKPDRGNSKKRSDGSQFYIVTGRKYSDAELNDIEKETGYRFSSQQRQIYKTIGGAPHIDGTYTIFGEVTDGMDIADQIAAINVDSDFRPLKDIRITEITIIE